jgi:hypothetical protein
VRVKSRTQYLSPWRPDRSAFDRFVEAAYLQVSRAPFFFVCVAAVALWLASVPLWVDLKAWQVPRTHSSEAVKRLRDAVSLEERH